MRVFRFGRFPAASIIRGFVLRLLKAVKKLSHNKKKHCNITVDILEEDLYLVIATQKVTSNVQTVPRQSPDIY
jgi:hypothetical protein